MFDLRLAKSIMEQEDGMNHLLIQFLPIEVSIETAILSIKLTKGLHRDINLNGYDENESQEILLDLSYDKDVLIEIYTQTAVCLDEATVFVTLGFNDKDNKWNEFSKDITIGFFSGEEMDAFLELDQQVIERVKELRNLDAAVRNSDEFMKIQPKIYELKSNKFAYLEHKYRVDY